MIVTNGCTCHYISYDIRKDGVTCLSCKGRKKQKELGLQCVECNTGIYTSKGDEDNYEGFCTECYYDKYWWLS
jgi:hypothetical protein